MSLNACCYLEGCNTCVSNMALQILESVYSKNTLEIKGSNASVWRKPVKKFSEKYFIRKCSDYSRYTKSAFKYLNIW